MAKKLTSEAIKKLSPGPDRIEHKEGGTPGLYVVVFPSGTKSFVLRSKKDGKTAKITLGPFEPDAEKVPLEPKLGDPLSLAAARRLAAEENHKRKSGVGGPLSSTGFAKAAKDYVEQHAKVKTRRWQDTARQLGLTPDLEIIPGSLADRWRDKRVDRITGEDLYAVLEEVRSKGVPGLEAIVKGRSESRARAFFAAVSSLFTWMTKTQRLRVNVAKTVHRPDPSKSRERVLTEAEVAAFWRAADQEERFGPMLKFLLLTGQRLNEVAGLRAGEVTGDVWTIPADRNKSKRTHVVPLSRQALELLEGASEWSGWMGSKLKARLDERMVKELGTLPPFRLHDARRTAATHMAELGFSGDVIELILNHARPGVAGIYNRSQLLTQKRAALQGWADHVDALVSRRKDDRKVVPIRG